MVWLSELGAHVGQVFVGLVFLYAGLRKLRDIDGAQIAILDYHLIPAHLARLLAPLLGGFEITIGTALIVGMRVAVPIGLLLLAIMSTAVGTALARGLNIDCHCFGEGEKVSRATLVRNAVFAAALAVNLLLRTPNPSLFAPQFLTAPLSHLLGIGSILGAIVMTIMANRTVRRSAFGARGRRR